MQVVPCRSAARISLALTCLAFTAVGCRKHPQSTASQTSARLQPAPESQPAPALPPGSEAYTDPATGVSFGYPPDWTPQGPDSGLASPVFQPLAGAAKVKLSLHPKGTAFEHTNLVGLTFSYTAGPNSSALDCADVAAKSPTGTGDIHSRAYNATTFNEGSGSDAGMCHAVAQTVDTTLRGGKCLVFERDFETECPDISGKGTRELTPAERTALQRQLDAIMNSVTFGHSPTAP